MTQSSTEIRVHKRIGFRYVAAAVGLAIAIGALVALGSLQVDPSPAAMTATKSAAAWQTVEVPTIVVYLVESDHQAETIRAMENELDYFWNESRETRPPREVQIFVADTPAGAYAANQYLADVYMASADQFQLQVQLLDMRR